MSWTDLLPAGAHGHAGVPENDAAAVTVINAHERSIVGEDRTTLDMYVTDQGEPEFDPERDGAYVLDDEGNLLALAQFRNRPPYVHSWTQAWVHPDQLGHGIGSALVAWAEDLGRRSLDRAPDDTRVSMSMGANERDERTRRLYAAHGYEPSRFFLEMEIALEDEIDVVSLPVGIELRTLAPDEPVDRLAATVDDAFKDHFGYTESPLEDRIARWQQWRTSEMWDDSLVWFAMDGNEVAAVNVALAHDGARTDQGYVATLGVRPPWRGRGIARALLTECFAEYRRRGKGSVSLHVDADSLTGATRLYTGVGMVEVQREIDFEKELRPGTDIVVR